MPREECLRNSLADHESDAFSGKPGKADQQTAARETTTVEGTMPPVVEMGYEVVEKNPGTTALVSTLEAPDPNKTGAHRIPTLGV